MCWMLLYYLLAFQLLFFQVFSAPTPPTPHIAQPTTYKPGDIVALPPTAYEHKYDTNVRRPPALLSLLTESGLKIEFQQKDLPKHPGVILSGPTEKGHYRVAIVSSTAVVVILENQSRTSIRTSMGMSTLASQRWLAMTN